MKPTTRHNIERRLEAMEAQRAVQERTPELRLILDNGDGTKQIRILGKGGVFIVPAKMEPEQWAKSAERIGKNQ